MSVLETLFTDSEDPTVTIFWLKRQLGHRGGERSLRNYVHCLVDECGFPPPLPHAKRGGGLERGVTTRSEWRREAVLTWLEDFLPPDCIAKIDEQARRRAANEMDLAAANLRLVGGREATL